MAMIPKEIKQEAKKELGHFTDEAFLHQYFHHYLHHMYHNDFIANMINDGFDEPLDPDYLCEAIYCLADRLGYKLDSNNMWVEK